jgi:hypothetical protein
MDNDNKSNSNNKKKRGDIVMVDNVQVSYIVPTMVQPRQWRFGCAYSLLSGYQNFDTKGESQQDLAEAF